MVQAPYERRADEPSPCGADTDEDDGPFLIVGKDDLGEEDRNRDTENGTDNSAQRCHALDPITDRGETQDRVVSVGRREANRGRIASARVPEIRRRPPRRRSFLLRRRPRRGALRPPPCTHPSRRSLASARQGRDQRSEVAVTREAGLEPVPPVPPADVTHVQDEPALAAGEQSVVGPPERGLGNHPPIIGSPHAVAGDSPPRPRRHRRRSQ